MAKYNTMDDVMEKMRTAFNAKKAEKFQGVTQYNVSGEGGKDFYVEIQNGECTIADGAHPEPTVTWICNFEDFLTMFADANQANVLFMQGKIKVKPMESVFMAKFETMFKP